MAMCDVAFESFVNQYVHISSIFICCLVWCRYDKLHMFSICNSIYEQELKNENELYVAFKEEDRDEVTFITLPVKVMKKETVPPFVSPDLGFSANSVIITSLVQVNICNIGYKCVNIIFIANHVYIKKQ